MQLSHETWAVGIARRWASDAVEATQYRLLEQPLG
jgi:hypothetical protein